MEGGDSEFANFTANFKDIFGHLYSECVLQQAITCCSCYWVIQAGLLTPLAFAWHRLRPLAAFTSSAYFLHNGRWWLWIREFYTATLKTFLEAHSQNVYGNKQ